MSDQPAENAQPEKSSHEDIGDGSIRPKDQLPPELTDWERVTLRIADLVFFGALFFITFIAFLWLARFRAPDHLPLYSFWAYISSGLLLAGLFVDRYLRHQKLVHESRLEDRSEVEALFVEAQAVEPRLTEPITPQLYSEKKEKLDWVVDRLKQLGPKGWTEYQVLPLNQLLVEFLKVDDLKARAQSELAVLQDYAEDTAYRYDYDLYSRWKYRIENASEKIDETEAQPDLKRDKACEQLRAELKDLLEHITDYRANWAEGSAVVRGLMICGAVAVPIFIVMGLLPILYPGSNVSLGVLHWGVFGISGSTTAVLLYLYKSNRVEVGNTEGKSELWRAILGATLGFIAGVLIHSAISGGLIKTGTAIPELGSLDPKDVGLSIILPFVAGFWFEGIFDRIRRSLERES